MPSRLLYQGCEPGLDVMDLQDGLNAVTGLAAQASAHPLLAVDGIFGGKTGTRVREFQQLNGLAADGVVGGNTWSALVGLLQSVPGLQINRPLGGSGPGPAKGTAGQAVYGKTEAPAPGKGSPGKGSADSDAGKSYNGTAGAKQGGGQDSAGPKWQSPGKGSTGGKSGFYGDGGSKQMSNGSGGGWAPMNGGREQDRAPAFKGYYKSSGQDGSSGKSSSSGSGGGGKVG